MKNLLKPLKLLLPALIPSWRFFHTIAPSPRVEFCLLESAEDMPRNWQEFRPRPPRLSFGAMLGRMIWNPRWNESLFLVSCAERLIINPTGHSAREIVKRIQAELGRNTLATSCLQFRLAFISRPGVGLQKHIVFVSPVYSAELDS